jgi:N-acetylglucosamine-6-phosphate deacetylase
MSEPSLFDIQINGFAGVDFQRLDLSQTDLRHAVDVLRAHQTYRIFLTLITDKVDALCRKFERIAEFRQNDPLISETVCGYHLEGPFLSPEEGYCGAHPAELQQAPNFLTFQRLQEAARGNIRLVTVAPEWPEAPQFIADVAQTGVVVSLGHTNASNAHIDDAIRGGATLCTHLGNAVPQNLPRHDNVVQRLLARDELTACLIPDGVHLPPFVLKNFFRAKPKGKVILTTDAMAAAAAPPGRYTLGAIEVEARDGAVRQPGRPNLAGSCLVPNRGVINAAQWLDISPAEARGLFSTRVAAHFGIDLPLIATG